MAKKAAKTTRTTRTNKTTRTKGSTTTRGTKTRATPKTKTRTSTKTTRTTGRRTRTRVTPIPQGSRSLTPYIIVKNAQQAIEFYKKAFGAKEKYRIEDPTGVVGHAELRIGDSALMLSEEFPDMNAKGPHSIGGSPVGLHLYVKNVDAAAKRAVDAGMKVVQEVENQFYGERSGKFEDPFGHVWSMSSRIEVLTPKEMQKRAMALFNASK